MDFTAVLKEVNIQIGKLEQIRALLMGMSAPGPARKSEPIEESLAAAKSVKVRKVRTLTPESRKRIVEAQKRRWAEKRTPTAAAIDNSTGSQLSKESSTEAVAQ